MSTHRACVVLGEEGEIKCACNVSNSLLDYIIYGHTSWCVWCYLVSLLLNVLRVAKPEECNLSVAYRCH